jgi:hypothetical protein
LIVAETLTDGNIDEAETALALIDNVEGDIESLTADAAYDIIAIYDVSAAQGVEVVIRLRALHSQSQEAEVVMACNILNRMTRLRKSEFFAIGA